MTDSPARLTAALADRYRIGAGFRPGGLGAAQASNDASAWRPSGPVAARWAAPSRPSGPDRHRMTSGSCGFP
jgi:hypothetical protein